MGADGKPDIAKSRDSALGIGVPGTVAGLTLALEKYGSGKFTLADLLKPAIDLARDGFVIADDLADTLPGVAPAAGALAVVGKDIFPRRRQPLRDGDTLVQTDLAATLSAISPSRGRAGFTKARSRKNWPRPSATPAAS